MNNHVPGVIAFVAILMVGSFIGGRYEHGYLAEVPGTDRALVKFDYTYKNKKWRKLHSRAMDYYKDGDYKMAEKTLQQILDQTQTEPAAFSSMGNIKLWLDNVSGAEVCFKKALKLAPRTASGTAGLAAVASYRGQHEKSAKLYEEALSYRPNFAHLHYDLAVEYEYLRKYAAARKHFEKVAALIPDTQLGKRSEARAGRIGDLQSQDEKRRLGYR